MTTLFDPAFLQSIAFDPRLPWGIAVAIIAGLVRGFTGFGSALIYIPLVGALYGPQIAAASFVMIDLVTGTMFATGLKRRPQWNQVLPLAIAAIITAQFGVFVLRYADPEALRWAISFAVLALLPPLALGWRYPGTPSLPVTIAVGGVSGFCAGATQMGGPPVMLYWLGSNSEASVVRANLVTYFALLAPALVLSYAFNGVLTQVAFVIALILGPLHLLATWAGAQGFRFASEETYRRFGYAIIALAGIVSMPVFERFWR